MTPLRVRFLIETSVVVAVAAAADVAHLGRAGIYAAVGAAWAAVGLVEYRLSRRSRD